MITEMGVTGGRKQQVYRLELPSRYLRVSVKKSDKCNFRSQLMAEDINMGITSI